MIATISCKQTLFSFVFARRHLFWRMEAILFTSITQVFPFSLLLKHYVIINNSTAWCACIPLAYTICGTFWKKKYTESLLLTQLLNPKLKTFSNSYFKGKLILNCANQNKLLCVLNRQPNFPKCVIIISLTCISK